MSKVRRPLPFRFFFLKKFAHTNQITALGFTSRANQIAASGKVSRTNQIAVQGYVSRTNHIIEFEYLAPITAFGSYFLVNEVMDHGAMHKE